MTGDENDNEKKVKMRRFGRILATRGRASLRKRLAVMHSSIIEEHARLLCVCDFDHTISAYHLHDKGAREKGASGERSLSSHSIVENAGFLGTAFSEESERRFQKYYPLETNPRISIDERLKICDQWWGESHEAIIAAGFTKGMVARAVKATEARLRIREGATDFFSLFQSEDEEKSKRRELIVFSAGLADIIEEIVSLRVPLPSDHNAGCRPCSSNAQLRNKGFTGCLIDCCGNRMIFEKAGEENAKVIAFGEIIHSCNKGEAVAKELRHLHAVEDGEGNAAAKVAAAAAAAGQDRQKRQQPFVSLIVGDSVGDCAMGDALEPLGGEDGCLRVGYLNHDDADNERRAHYSTAGFDLLVLDDGPLDAVSALIRGLSGDKRLLDEIVDEAEELRGRGRQNER